MTAVPIKVLVIDDDPPIRKLLRMGLSTQGYDILDATNGKMGLELLGEKPDVIILDLGLPVMDGFELAERLRTDCGLDDVALIAITGYAQALDRERTATCGFRGHLAKPVDVHIVNEMIRELQETKN